MNRQSSRKIFSAIGMAVFIAIGVVAFSMQSNTPASVASVPAAPAKVVPSADPVPAVAPVSDLPVAVAQTPDAPAPVAQRDIVGVTTGDTAANPVAKTTPAVERHIAKASVNTGAPSGAVARTARAVDASEKSAARPLPSSIDAPVASVDPIASPPATAPMAADGQAMAMGAEPAASDSRITTEVRSGIAADSGGNANIGVTTTRGVVVLTGTMSTQAAVEHVKDVAEKVKDVKSVDTSGIKITTT